MFALGAIVIVAGFSYDHADFALRLMEKEQRTYAISEANAFDWRVFLSAAALLFSSFIGFDSIAQAGGEARNPTRSLPLAIGLAILVVGSFYFLFTAAVYHAVPWTFVAQEALTRDISAPGMLSYLLPAGLSVAILAGAAVALINDLPAMLLAVSRLMFAWAEDGIFPARIARVHRRFNTPHLALVVSGSIASLGVLGSHFAGDFFLGIDIMVTAMMVNFLLVCLTLVTLPRVNPLLASRVTLLKHSVTQKVVGWAGTLVLGGFLLIHVWKDLSAPVAAWYFHSSLVWLIVMILGSVLFFTKLRSLRNSGTNIEALFSSLPEQ
jgi:APA family basic amino acid/polyamine antiporter